MKKIFILFIIAFFAITSCDKAPNLPQIKALPDSSGHGVFIINEGNYMQGNAELSFLDLGLNQKFDNVFFQANKRKLGDVFQSINIINGNAYLVINNSSKIEIINPKTFKSIGAITGLHSPRYIIKTSTNKAYLSDIYDNNIFVVDLSNNQILKKIPLWGWVEEMISINGKTYATNLRGSYINIIDENTDQIIDSIETPFAPKNILKDSSNNLWVLCGDANANNKKHFIVKIDLKTKQIIKQFEIKTPLTNANKLRINAAANTLFWIDEGVFRMSVNDSILPPNPIIDKQQRIFYGLAIDPKYHEIMVSDAKDFNSNSDVYRYDFNGQLLGKFIGGKITSDFYFYYN